MPEPGNYVKCDYRDGTYAVAVVERVNGDGSVYVALDRARFATFDAVDVELVDDVDDVMAHYLGLRQSWPPIDFVPERFDAPGCQMCGADEDDPCDCFDPQEGP